MTLVAIAIYLLAVVVANLVMTAATGLPLQQFVVVDAVVCFLFIAVDLVVRDALHERWERSALWPRMLALVGAGSLLSFLLNGAAGRVALASFAAFFAAGLTDTAVYTLLHGRPRLVRINASNVASALTDSLVWPLIALGSFVPLVTAIEFAAKVGGGVLWGFLLVRTLWPALRRTAARPSG
ncbi:VUT family protein [Thermomicrobium sp. 4228-Ro]|uniref:VUT family protein n=1 Tax=Thermomicrobium sp. 4228-Ro TaxID=2993937 RepID=UPI0022489002|nr:VUT family protein [Thermomicrobium sp. 4228-Ro]MCX2727199.1 VUT family protein [Thermomicrobium sp. 4228-Ro]